MNRPYGTAANFEKRVTPGCGFRPQQKNPLLCLCFPARNLQLETRNPSLFHSPQSFFPLHLSIFVSMRGRTFSAGILNVGPAAEVP
jgi:hypothetical protein